MMVTDESPARQGARQETARGATFHRLIDSRELMVAEVFAGGSRPNKNPAHYK